MLWKGSQVQQEEDEEAVTKKAIKESEIFVSQIFYSFFLFVSFFQLLYFITFFLYFFTHDICPHPHPRPTTFTHDPRPTTFRYVLSEKELILLRAGENIFKPPTSVMFMVDLNLY